ncbi:Rhomboid domain-containing protein 1-like [Scleropages formosus]|uniref:Rhomboid domain-containing protein 1-like n=1 Tax=Scleropages formosus TaxID=113540 RepID=A0A0P7UCQ3_SCLFO|nr:Rhomboid domain-containing protein 1-like [Scleropages formosus]
MIRQRRGHLGLLLLASQVFQVGLDNIPPVTLAVLALNVYLYLVPLGSSSQACISVEQAYWRGDWRRLLLSPLHHVDDWHLYVNMASLLWKGVHLERRLGGHWFAYLIVTFSLLTGVVYLLLALCLSELTQDYFYSMQCAVGFSGVLFALKVVNNHYNPGGVTYVMNIPVSNKFACWVELVAIHVLSPGTSFLGHLAGILVGLLYVKGPLKIVMKKCAGYSGYYTHNQPSSRLHQYTAGLSEEQQYEAAIRASLNDTGGTTQDWRPHEFNTPAGPDAAEELRQRRLRRFQ